MKITIPIHLEAIPETALRHLEDRVLHSHELRLDPRILWRQITQRTEHFQRRVFSSFQDQPARRFWQARNGADDEQRKDNLEGNRESP